MKKHLIKIAILFLLITPMFAQTNSTVDINDDVYYVLSNAEIQNLCKPLITEKPFTQSYIKSKLNEILSNLESKEQTRQVQNEIEIINIQLAKFENETGFHPEKASVRWESNDEKFPTSFEFSDTLQGFISGGLYQNSNQNSYGYELFNNFIMAGDLGHNISYKTKAYIGVTCMPLETLGKDYEVGEWWYNRDGKNIRTINTYRNNSVLPYAYNKYWDGSIYYLTNLSSCGLEGWPTTISMGFGMFGDLFASFYDGKVELGLSRIYREWGGMDDGSSLVLNANARPFLGFESRFHIFDWLSLSTITGVLEFPNQDYINDNCFYYIDEDGKKIDPDDSKNLDYYFYQNAFSMGKLAVRIKNLYIDAGSSCVWPKRFEMGYGFPLIDRVVYQNSVGDYDNLALFGNIKYTQPGIGSIWFSAYLDEVSEFKIKFWEKTRAMFAAQAGTKINLPFLPFSSISFRYTKVEPYCYTHHSINYTSWYDHYISESYTNNGYGLGYYLQPNSDEFNLKFETIPNPNTKFAIQYQLIRHGADWGSGAVPGSNFYSELDPQGRDDKYKYFLRDGTYEWSNIITLSGSYKFNQSKVPVKLSGSVGYIYDWFTTIDGSEGGRDVDYHYINNEEYSDKNGFVISVGFELF